MNDSLGKMLEKYPLNNLEDHLLALREILQEIALLGLWSSKFFDKAAFYGVRRFESSMDLIGFQLKIGSRAFFQDIANKIFIM